MNAQTRTYSHRLVISRPDEIPTDDAKNPVEPLGTYTLHESEQEAREAMYFFIVNKAKEGYTASLIHEGEYVLGRAFGPNPEDTVQIRLWVEPLPVIIVVPATTIAEVRSWFESLPLHAANPS